MRDYGRIVVLVGIASLAMLGRSGHAPAQEGQSKQVEIYDGYFAPAQVAVPIGTTVVWMNQGQSYHTVTSTQGVFDSGVIRPGAGYYFTFTAPGKYVYHDNYHRRVMWGVVSVR